MTLTELRYIVAVAEKRHFGQAAEACHVSQPTLSVAVKRLEEDLGVTLFERARNEISLTAVGERVVAQAQRALAEAAAVREVATASRDQLGDPLRLGAIYTIGPYLLPQLIPEVRNRAPQMQLLISENYTHELRARLRNGELDAILVALPFDEPGIETLPLYHEPFMVLLPTSHPLSARQELDKQDLDEETVLLLGPGHCFRDQVLDACPGCAHESDTQPGLQKSLEGASLETIRMMVSSGVGVTVLPCSATAVSQGDRLVTLRRFASPVPGRDVALAWRKSFPRPRAIATIAESIRHAPMSCVSKFSDTTLPDTPTSLLP